MRPYLALALAIASELAGTTALKYSDGFTNPLPSAVVLLGYLGAFYLLSLTLQDLDLGLVYATWAAVGIVGSVAIGVALFEESLDLAGVVGVTLVVAGVVVLNVFSEAYTPAH
ncbi:multidrug efflux SMR transporter [Halobacteria archaeon HArc-gm2]|nr:multidrug efflux SMR transporter [Halobacteria archaeon HArc-gm2]